MVKVDEIAPDLFRLSVYVPDFDMQFNHFLVRDEEPLLFHAGFKGMFPVLREAVATLIDPATLRHIAWSHFESDEIGALNHWLELAPEAQPVCTLVGKLVSVDDFSIRPARGMTAEDVLATGKYRFRFHRSPHLPHGWDAGVLFEETRKTLFCSDLFHHFGDAAPTTTSDLIGPARAAMQQMQQGPLADYMPYTHQTEGVLRGLATLEPETLAVMHGSSYIGPSGKLIGDLADVLKENFGGRRAGGRQNVEPMPRDDMESRRRQVAIAAAEVAALNAAINAIAGLRNSSDSHEQEHSRGCARAAGWVGGRISDAERGLGDAKRALAEAEGNDRQER